MKNYRRKIERQTDSQTDGQTDGYTKKKIIIIMIIPRSSLFHSFMFHRWIFAPEFCRVAAFMQHVSVTCSVYTLVAIGVDR